MSKHHNWQEVDKDIIGGMKDVAVAIKWDINAATVNYHRKHVLCIEQGQPDTPQEKESSYNPHYYKPMIEVLQDNIRRKLSHLSPEHRRVFMAARGPLSAGSQFMGGMTL